MEKRGISDIITTVIIILMVLAAIVIVWQAVRLTIGNASNQIGVEKFNVNFESRATSLSNDIVNVSVTRRAGQGNISEIKIVFKNATSSCTYINNTRIPNELETVIYYVDMALCRVSNPTSYEVYPVFIVNGKEEIGLKAGTSSGGSSSGGTSGGTGIGALSCKGTLASGAGCSGLTSAGEAVCGSSERCVWGGAACLGEITECSQIKNISFCESFGCEISGDLCTGYVEYNYCNEAISTEADCNSNNVDNCYWAEASCQDGGDCGIDWCINFCSEATQVQCPYLSGCSWS